MYFQAVLGAVSDAYESTQGRAAMADEDDRTETSEQAAPDPQEHGPNPAYAAQPPGTPGWSQPEYSPGADPYHTAPPAAEPSLEHGPNPAVSAQPGVDAAQAGVQFQDYPPGADPHSDHTHDPAPRKGKAAKAEERDERKATADDHRSAGGRAGHRA